MKTTGSGRTRKSREENLPAHLEVKSPKGDMPPDESRLFYRWLEERWGVTSELEESAPTRYLMDELDQRGSRIQGLTRELETAREKLLEREIQMVRMESRLAEHHKEMASLTGDVNELQERYRKALLSSTEARRQRRDMEQEMERLKDEHAHAEDVIHRLNAHVEQLMAEMAGRLDAGAACGSTEAAEGDLADELEGLLRKIDEAEERARAAEALRKREGDHYREVFGQKDNRVRELEHALVERERQVRELQTLLQSWPIKNAIKIYDVFKK